ncbi:hypothetical protein PoMZ_12464 [Pyricularia oryzae]|nr:hypothetical protein PoMZ_12464 [Pyricularia oryzae]
MLHLDPGLSPYCSLAIFDVPIKITPTGITPARVISADDITLHTPTTSAAAAPAVAPMASITKLTRVIARKAMSLIKKKKTGNEESAFKPKIAVRWLAEEPDQFLGPFCG